MREAAADPVHFAKALVEVVAVTHKQTVIREAVDSFLRRRQECVHLTGKAHKHVRQHHIVVHSGLVRPLAEIILVWLLGRATSDVM